MSSTRATYRNILREMRLAYKQPRIERSRSITRSLRRAFAGEGSQPGLTAEQAANVQTFLRAHRLHKTLVARYNPGGDLTGEERIKATARRVGLDTPKDIDLETPLDGFKPPDGNDR